MEKLKEMLGVPDEVQCQESSEYMVEMQSILFKYPDDITKIISIIR
jgi:hypothetical protein